MENARTYSPQLWRVKNSAVWQHQRISIERNKRRQRRHASNGMAWHGGVCVTVSRINGAAAIGERNG